MLTRNTIDICAAKAGNKDAVDLAVHNLWLLQQLPLRVLSAIKQHDCFLSSYSNTVWTPAEAEMLRKPKLLKKQHSTFGNAVCGC